MQTEKSPLGFLKFRLILGIGLLVLACTFGAISKLFYPTRNGLSIPTSLQYCIGTIQLACIILLLREKWRRWGVMLCAILFAAFVSISRWDNPSSTLFSILGLGVCASLWGRRLEPNVSMVRESKAAKSIPIKLDIPIVVEEGKPEDKKANLWMETADEKDILDWLYESEEESEDSFPAPD
ncbi:MAG: hypothetical protein VX278_10680 [Myxococcota bacterium]|nr:hypothetical protein [Myxococcota bacterium]